MAELNWNLARVPDFGTNALQFQQAGREQGMATAKQNALALYAQNPDAGIKAYTAIDPIGAGQLRKEQQAQAAYAATQAAGAKVAAGDYKGAAAGAAQAGQFDLASQIGGMQDHQLAAAAKSAEQLASYASTLGAASPDPAVRKQVLLADKASLVAKGIDPATIDNFEPTDDNIGRVVNDALGVKGQVEKAQKDREFGLQQGQFAETGRHNVATEGQATAQLSESSRHNRADEGQGAAKISLEGAQLGETRRHNQADEGNTAAKVAAAGAGGKPTQDQAQTAMGVQRMVNANTTLNTLEAGHFNPTLSAAGSWVLGNDARQYETAKGQWSDSLLRATTGAAATKAEMQAIDRQYFPQPGDSKDVVVQKAAARKTAEDAMRTRASGQRPDLSASPAPTTRPPNPQRGQVVSGYRYNGGPPGSPDSWSKQ